MEVMQLEKKQSFGMDWMIFLKLKALLITLLLHLLIQLVKNVLILHHPKQRKFLKLGCLEQEDMLAKKLLR